jgi:hypothetical protein
VVGLLVDLAGLAAVPFVLVFVHALVAVLVGVSVSELRVGNRDPMPTVRSGGLRSGSGRSVIALPGY